MLQVNRNSTDLVTVHNRAGNSELLFSGSGFGLEKKPFPLILSANYAIVGVFLLYNAGFSLESVCWSAVIFSLSAGILTRLRGRWLALMAFSVPILLKILQGGIGRMDFMVFWIVALISLSAAFSSFKVVSGFANWLKSRQASNS